MTTHTPTTGLPYCPHGCLHFCKVCGLVQDPKPVDAGLPDSADVQEDFQDNLNHIRLIRKDGTTISVAVLLANQRSALIASERKRQEVTGETSDGYHTFNELYRYRKLYNAAFFNELSPYLERVHKSWKHSDGELCFGGGWFIVMAYLDDKQQISNHYETKDWDLFQIPERDTADAWDGSTPEQEADRLEAYLLKGSRILSEMEGK